MARIDIPEGEGDELIRMWGVNPTMGRIAGTFSAKVYENSEVPIRERELVRMRIAKVNACPV